MKKKENNVKETLKKETTKSVKEETISLNTEGNTKKIPVLYYIVVFLTVLSTLLIATAGVFNVELGNDYADLIRAQGADQTYVNFYQKQHQTDAIYHLGIAGVVGIVGIYFANKIRKEDLLTK